MTPDACLSTARASGSEKENGNGAMSEEEEERSVFSHHWSVMQSEGTLFGFLILVVAHWKLNIVYVISNSLMYCPPAWSAKKVSQVSAIFARP